MPHQSTLWRWVARSVLTCSAFWLAAPAANAQPTSPSEIKGLTDKLGLDAAPENRNLLGEPYENPVAGVAFRPPTGCVILKRPLGGEGNVIAEFTNDEKQWLLKVTKPTLGRPMPLQTVKGIPAKPEAIKPGPLQNDPLRAELARQRNEAKPLNESEQDRVGLLDWTVAEILKTNRTAVVERQEIVNVREYGVGLAILHITLGTEKFLRQQAIFQVDEQNYFVFNLTTPAAKNGDAANDAGERQAAEAFKQMIDTIQVLDQSWIRKDQVQRLFRTRAVFVDWNHLSGQMIKDAIVKEQWLRLIKDGKDFGYSVVYEEFIEGRNVRENKARANDGVLISIRSRTIDGDTQVDVGSQLFSSLDRKHEDWAHVVNVITNKGKPKEDKEQSSEYGFSELRTSKQIDRTVVRDDPKNPPLREIESYRLNVVRPKSARDSLAKPESYAPSPWYIPQAIGVMLPRLLPVHKPVTYMFQTYVGDQRAVVHRYVDVGFEKDVVLDGKTVRAIPITDRVRLEGAATTHFMSPEGKWLGSYNEEAKVTILPSDEATLRKLWNAPDLSRPEDIKHPGSAAGTPSPIPAGRN